jgi:hypothetical protein
MELEESIQVYEDPIEDCIEDLNLFSDSKFRGNQFLKYQKTTDYVEPEAFKKLTEEIYKCSEDIIYFAENYFTIVNPEKGKHIIKPYKKQKELIETFKNHDRIVTLASRQVGKCVKFDTKITIKNDKTGEIIETTVGKFHEMCSTIS